MDEDRTKSVLVSIQIPDGAEPGDSLCFDSNGQTFTIEIPPASVPGEVLQIRLAKHDEDVEMKEERAQNDDCTTKGHKISIEMPTGSRISIIQSDDEAISNESHSDGTHQLLWPASRFVIKFMNTPQFYSKVQGFRMNSVFELGAGHGIFGLAFADIVSHRRQTNDPMKLVLTDVEEALPQLQRNVDANSQLFSGKLQMSVLPLKWHNNPIPRTNGIIDVILGSDLLYNCKVIPDLAATIRRLVSPCTKILFSVRWRKPSEERSFFVMLSDIIEWKLIHGTCPLDYRVYGNGSFESNKFFSQTMVGVKGAVTPLSSINERHTELMSDEEFQQYEDLQTQVYLGEVVKRRSDIDHLQKRSKATM